MRRWCICSPAVQQGLSCAGLYTGATTLQCGRPCKTRAGHWSTSGGWAVCKDGPPYGFSQDWNPNNTDGYHP